MSFPVLCLHISDSFSHHLQEAQSFSLKTVLICNRIRRFTKDFNLPILEMVPVSSIFPQSAYMDLILTYSFPHSENMSTSEGGRRYVVLFSQGSVPGQMVPICETLNIELQSVSRAHFPNYHHPAATKSF